MRKRLFIVIILGVLVFGGLVAGLFTGAITRALTVPMDMMGLNNPATKNTNQLPTSAGTTAAKPGATQQAQTVTPPQTGEAGQPTNTLVQDTFQRANQQLWGTSSDGRVWGADANTSQAFSIVNGKGQIAQGNAILSAVIGLQTDNVEVVSDATVNQFGNNVNFGVVLRWQDPDNWYKAQIDGDNLSILKRFKGQTTTIATKHMDAFVNVTHTIRFRAIGATLFAKEWRSDAQEPNGWDLTTDDTDLKTGQVGIRVSEQATTVISVTSFKSLPAAMGNGA
jgi:hypothetical protein